MAVYPYLYLSTKNFPCSRPGVDGAMLRPESANSTSFDNRVSPILLGSS